MATPCMPDNYPRVTPYLAIDGAGTAIEFYKKAFGATERMRFDAPGAKIGHAEIDIEGGLIMLADAHPDMDFRSPKSLGGSPVTIHIYVADVDAFCAGATAAGAAVLRPVADQFYGDRSCQLRDPFGHTWSFATHVEDVSPEEMQKRAAKLGA
ncbi:MAG: VOC family protein [Burkholderiales bacterium]